MAMALEEPSDEPAMAVAGPPLPMGRRIELRGRGTTFVREVAGPPNAPTVLLLHGWLASAGLNWFQAFDPLGARFRVVAVDHRGHGRGIRSGRRFRLADCADDAAQVLDLLGTGPVIAVGYSMGGPIAQLLWRRHPDLVSGLVLHSTAHRLMPGRREQWVFTTMMAAAAGTTRVGQMATKAPVRRVRSMFTTGQAVRPSTMQAWARAEMRRHSSRMVMEAGVAMSNYSAVRWIGQVDVPVNVVVTTKDRAISPMAQLQMAVAIPGAEIRRVDDGHLVCAKPSFARQLVQSCTDVATRAGVLPA